MSKVYLATFLILLVSELSIAQVCEEIFPDALSNSTNAGTIQFGWQSRVIDSPDGILDTTEIIDNSGGVSCDGSACVSSGNIADENNYNTFPNNQPNINLGYQESQTISPGNYGGLVLGSEATLTMEPGVYVFRDAITFGFNSELIVDSPGSVVIYARLDVNFNSSVTFNGAGGDRSAFIFSRGNVVLLSDSSYNGVIYARGNVALHNGVDVVGAITARGDINLYSSSNITYDSSTVSGTNYDGWCTSSATTFPNLIAEWRLDELSWNGSQDEVQDSSGNGLHGEAISHNGSDLPTTDINNPAITGDPGTCSYGSFNGTASGYVQINDPGSNSILDLDEAYTVSTWVYAQSWPSSGLATIVSKDENFEFHLNSNGRVFWWWGGGNQQLTSSQAIPINEWHHLAIVFQPGEQNIYLDGELIGTKASTQNITVNNDPVFIGTDLNIHSRRFNGLIDEVRIYDGALTEAQVEVVMADTHACVVGDTLDSFELEIGGGNASVCEPYEITITARGTSGDIYTGYIGTINLSTSTGNGDWAIADADGSLFVSQPSADSGEAEYSFESTGLDQGQIVLSLDNQHAESLVVTVSDPSLSISSSSETINFSENAFVIEENDGLGSDLISGRRHQFKVMLMEQAPDGFDDDNCAIATNYNESSIKAWFSRSTADPNGNAPSINNSSLSSSLVLAESESGAQNIDLNFNSGIAAFSIDTSDVGQFSIEFLDDGLNFSDTQIRGSSDLLTVRPFAFRISAQGNPEASDEDGSIYTVAGDSFSVTVEALGWHSSDDLNDNGVPDTYEESSAQPSNDDELSGAALLSFGKESPSESVLLSSSLYTPVTGTPSAIVSTSNASLETSNFNSGVASFSDIYFPEVGIIQILAQINGSYLGASVAETLNTRSQSALVGRFVPSFFEITNAVFDNNCGSFSYFSLSRSASMTLTAKNSLGTTTTNYRDEFVKLNVGQGSVELGAVENAGPINLSGNISSSEQFTWDLGSAAVQSDITLSRTSEEVGPYTDVNIGVSFTDRDGVTVEANALNLDIDDDGTDELINIGSGEYRSGRLVLPNAHGPESAALRAEFNTEYWGGSSWLTNSDDSCTSIAAEDILFPDGTLDVSSNLSTAVGAGSSTASFTDLSSGFVNFISGDAGLIFSAPGPGNTGTIDVSVDLDNYPWLQFNWDQNSSTDNTTLPTAEFSFGSYRGHDRIIYWREILSN